MIYAEEGIGIGSFSDNGGVRTTDECGITWRSMYPWSICVLNDRYYTIPSPTIPLESV